MIIFEIFCQNPEDESKKVRSTLKIKKNNQNIFEAQTSDVTREGPSEKLKKFYITGSS